MKKEQIELASAIYLVASFILIGFLFGGVCRSYLKVTDVISALSSFFTLCLAGYAFFKWPNSKVNEKKFTISIELYDAISSLGNEVDDLLRALLHK